MKASEVLKKYADGERDFCCANLRGQSFKGKNLSGADFSGTDIRGTNFTNANLKEAKFIGAEAGLQHRWAISPVIILLFLSVVLGFFPAIASSSVISLFLPLNLQEFDLTPAVLVLIVLTIFFITTICQGIEVGIGAGIGAVAGTMAISVALVWAGAKSGVLAVAVAGTGALAGAVAGTVKVAIVVAVARAVALKWAVLVALIDVIMAGVWSAISSRVAVTWAGTVVTAVGRGWAVMAMVVAETVTVLGIYIAWRALVGDEKHAFIRKIALSLAATKGTSFRNADLTDSDFTRATLKNTDFRKATLIRTCWRDAKNIDLARLGTTYLQNAQLQQLLTTGKVQDKNFERKDFRGVNLQGVDLAGASFVDADLSRANLQETNFFEAKLVRTNLDQANLSNSNLTGAYIEDWGITRKTRFDGVKCKYVYLKLPTEGDRDSNRIPPPKQGSFEENDFYVFITSVLDTLDLYHKQDINAGVAITVLKGLTKDYPVQFELVEVGKRGENQFLLKFKVYGAASHFQLQREYYARYEQTLYLYDPKKLMPDPENTVTQIIETVKENSGLHTVCLYNQGIFIVGENVNMTGDRSINTNTYYEQSGNFGIGHMSGGEIKEGAKVAGVINEAEKQNLAEAIQIIEALRKNLEMLSDREVYHEAVEHLNDFEAEAKKTTPKQSRLKAFLQALWNIGKDVTTIINGITALAERFGIPLPHLPLPPRN